MMPSIGTRRPTTQSAAGHPNGPAVAPDLGGLFRVRLSSKRRKVEAALDREIQRLCHLRSSLERADAEVVLAAIDYLGSPEKAAHWLSSPEASLGNTIPLYLAASEEGKAKVIERLMGLDP
jgi:uncharacterized protein (DUF2384 family)